jgi:hypothetical protein
MSQIAPITLVAPGSRGLNKEKENNLLDPVWATEADNCIIDRGGRIASRAGWADQTTTGISGSHSIDVLFEQIDKNGTKTIISTANNKIYKNITDFTDVANDITSTTAPSADNWQFVNFNDFCIGVQKGEAPIVRQSGDFADISFTGTGYDGNCIAAAFGRVWAADADLQTIRYSSLLDHTDMNTTGGTIDMSSVWTQGMDEIVAIAALGSNLIVFGRNHIIIWADGSGSEIGLDPLQMYVVDTIEGTGCIARDSVQVIGEGDILYLSRHGVQSLGRVIADKNNPLTSITKNIRSAMDTWIGIEVAASATLDPIRSVHSPEEGFYLLLLPSNDRFVCIDLKRPFVDEEGQKTNAITTWTVGGSIKSLLSRQNGDLLMGSSGVVGKYSGNLDDTSAYTMAFWSAWFNIPEFENHLKLLKEVGATIQIGGTGSATYRWEFDFLGTSFSKSVTYQAPTAAEYNVAKYNEDEYAGALTIQRRSFPGVGQGQFIRVGATLSINNYSFVIQQLTLTPKMGRIAT